MFYKTLNEGNLRSILLQTRKLTLMKMWTLCIMLYMAVELGNCLGVPLPLDKVQAIYDQEANPGSLPIFIEVYWNTACFIYGCFLIKVVELSVSVGSMAYKFENNYCHYQVLYRESWLAPALYIAEKTAKKVYPPHTHIHTLVP